MKVKSQQWLEALIWCSLAAHALWTVSKCKMHWNYAINKLIWSNIPGYCFVKNNIAFLKITFWFEICMYFRLSSFLKLATLPFDTLNSGFTWVREQDLMYLCPPTRSRLGWQLVRASLVHQMPDSLFFPALKKLVSERLHQCYSRLRFLHFKLAELWKGLGTHSAQIHIHTSLSAGLASSILAWPGELHLAFKSSPVF